MDIETKRRYTQAMLDSAELLFDEDECRRKLQRLADEITADLGGKYPLVLPVMGGAVVFTGQLLPLLRFPLDFDYVHVSRYGDKLKGGNFNWLRAPQESVADRHVLILDDILDEGHTMAAIKEQVLALGAASCSTAVFANKLIDKEKPITADYVGINVPNRYVFGYGMDAAGAWRNLGAVYALREQ
ncbi:MULTISPECIES: hypoxanthine-guanine phosphoribosyltransferase [Neisseria]|uniref:Hypoxanthine-guanine phosphoribosyltransferase n=1 Tax=Neisseria animaloris TaxID=326522 RepID=A0A1X3CMK8_9NEIS|nr:MULTISPECIES: hypoxanthine-guanine phosphoribosyltransferase [Neisseria]MDO1510008.1 hypoxanthine-guanine phosphoribosyltransferase [Neisseria sp. MVDL19-042950]MDO1516208.1 hypoxanthine-guanine phosphoribosyltransferase [Neisseria sp. MVDL18-041461]MDO1563323.1 hypoxanthine-guanine phosphoribosyltransferase [Neisseria sp. MVDL20-010259]MDO5073903.1 hypoxanthine-guanine phosphoribosyltransferase [Neisseria animaloris]OSI08621.1 hypoxanthine-guanine phosphoribosyltransferase [Neisseria anima